MDVVNIERIVINNFRCFKGLELKLGKFVTVISGQNATGKSTILGLLGHCAELKKKDGKPILHNQFRTEFSEIIKASLKFDVRTPLAYTIYFSGDDIDSNLAIPFRSTWQKYKNGRRFRLIPKRIPGRQTEKKLAWPTLYLGLSRLYPIGESKQLSASDFKLSPEKKNIFLKQHKKILSLNEMLIDCSEITIKETPKKTIGVETNKYDSITNSAGQDNLSQILLAAMSFQILKEHQGDNWRGGLLLIDELDATLHPAAQEKLVKYLYNMAKEIQMQVVFTTHSLSMLKYISEKCQHNCPSTKNPFELIYLTTRNKYLEMLPNPDYDTIHNDMLNTLSVLPTEYRKIIVYTEDAEARWFLKKLLRNYCSRIKLPNIGLGQQQLLKLLEEDIHFFKSRLFILDGDVSQNELSTTARRLGFNTDRPPNVVLLPGGTFPEKIFYDYLDNISGQHELYQKELAATGLSKRTLHECGPLSYTRYTKERERYKTWFNELSSIFEIVYPFWENDNEQLVKEFLKDFTESFNTVAKWACVPLIFDYEA